eukprot:CAMPEP_0116843468 /NCGR_PEP_ID=MMETSP0418-20121206/12106_1 /TAXON_ID=1158023 /ORGANISM="Astrosyne radiata, Strain 13vi08-1A" /LENGTH=506 /DNA_ID=CAMNT_0004474227 /DNA_START=27 /DNA_END=1547 /DNA_ORIENTATION=-
MAQYAVIFGITLLMNIIITFRSSALWKKFCTKQTEQSETTDPGEITRHQSLLKRYLVVYLSATLSDWLQGPYVYALYDAYGYSQHAIAVLFVAGFGSSMVFGSFVGGMADWGGRRRFVIIFAITYAASCITKHFKDFYILMLGRLLGGVATSLLFSVFEAWLIRSHADAKIGKTLLGQSFSFAAYGNSIIAILAGLMANRAANTTKMVPIADTGVYVGGFLNPFDIALVALVFCGSMTAFLWEENYGEEQKHDTEEKQGAEKASDDGRDDPRGGASWYSGLKNALVATMRSRDILLCGIVSSVFEGSMYIFVFMWTPALKNLTNSSESEVDLPFGLIFSTFMVCCMAGSSLFSILIGFIKGEALCVGVLAVASISMALVALSSSDTLALCAMNLFEVCVGMYWPIMGTMKGAIVPEDKRAAIYNLYRIPLNFIVLFSLLTDLSSTQSFILNCCMLAIATILQTILMTRRLNMSSMKDLKERTQQESSSPAEKQETESLLEEGQAAV